VASRESFLPHVRHGREALAAAPALDGLLADLLVAGQAAWPDLALPPEAFLRHVAERLPPDGDPVEALRAVLAGDLYLACACTTGDAAALQLFEKQFLAPVAEYVSRADALPAFTDDVKQALRARLLVAGEAALPKIAGYSGQGPLAAWLRMTATRVAIDLRNAERAHQRRDAAAPAPLLFAAPAADPELAYLRARYTPELGTAFRTTLAALSPRERTVLRLHFLEAMNAEAIGKVYRVSTRTVQRWLERTRGRILRETRRLLAERLDLSATQIDGLITLFHSQFDISVFTVLQGADE